MPKRTIRKLYQGKQRQNFEPFRIKTYTQGGYYQTIVTALFCLAFFVIVTRTITFIVLASFRMRTAYTALPPFPCFVNIVASVSRAVGLLKKDGYITIDKDGYISLTEQGKEKGKSIFERHTVLTKMLISLGVDEETAAEDACRMEHVISEKTFNAMRNHLTEKNK